MTSANHPRFRLLIGWCCLMSSVLLIMTVYLIKTREQDKSGGSTNGNEEKKNSTANSGNTNQQIGLRSFSEYINLIRDDEVIWKCYPCKGSSLSPMNNTVKITDSGLYSFHAQVTFILNNNNQATVTLRKNKVPGIQERILSKVKHYGSGTATMIRWVELTKGDIISLEIDPFDSISREPYDTYWEIILFNNKS